MNLKLRLIQSPIYEWLWNMKTFIILRPTCRIVGHEEITGSALEDDYCSRCYLGWPQDSVTLPVLLGRAYRWAVEHGWPEAVDLWLMKHVRLPGWWEY